jgi:hypothetical protein
MKNKLLVTIFLFSLQIPFVYAQQEPSPEEIHETVSMANPAEVEKLSSQDLAILDDKLLLEGYTEKYSEYTKDIVLAMIQDDTLADFKMAAAIRVFNAKYSKEVVYREKRVMEKILLRRLNRTQSAFVQVEAMYALLALDRYRYFKSMAPPLIQKLNHYNSAVNEFAFNYLDALTNNSTSRPREARIVFTTLRKILFLSRNRLANVTEPDQNLKYKLKLVRWSIKVLGTEELKRLPKEVINLL